MVLVLFTVFRVLHDARTYHRSVSIKLGSIAGIVGHNSTSALDFQDPGDAATTLAALESEPDVTHAWILDPGGRVFAAYRRPGVDAATPMVAREDREEVQGGSLTSSRRILRDGETIGFVALRCRLDGFWTILLRNSLSAILALAGGMGIALLLALRTQRTLSAPILELVDAVRRVARLHDLSLRMPEGRPDELGVLHRGFNTMLAELQAREHERNQALGALGDSETKYRELVMLANSIILRWSRDGRITFLNESGQRFFAYSESEILGRQVVGTVVPETESTGRDLRPLIQEICANPQVFERSTNENLRRSGERIWIDWTNKAVFDEHGQVSEILSIGSDVTERKRAEEEVARLHQDLQRHAAGLEQRVRERTAELAVARDQAESADRLKSAFLATMSHELRTPLNSIIGFTGILLQGLVGPLNPELKKQLGMVQSGARHLLDLINDVLDISKIEAGQLPLSPECFDLRECLEKLAHSTRPLADSKGIGLTVDVPEHAMTINHDRRRVEQVLLNLLSNAIKFTERGCVEVACLPGDKEVLVRVKDTGIGIKPEDLHRLFKPFSQIHTGLTRKFDGTGLGLSISKRLVELMGGRIWVDSQPDAGSVFTFTLPL